MGLGAQRKVYLSQISKGAGISTGKAGGKGIPGCEHEGHKETHEATHEAGKPCGASW